MNRIVTILSAISVLVGTSPQLRAANPVTLVGQMNVSGASFTTDVWGWVDPSTQKQYALMGNNNSGLHIIDVSDPGNPQLASIVTTVPSFDVKSWSTYAYTVDGNFGLDGGIVDISDPFNPVVVGSFPRAHNIFIDWRGLMYATGPGLRIYVISGTEANPFMVYEDLTTEGHDATVITTTLYFFSGVDGTFIYDVLSPLAPVLLGSITDPAITYHHNGWPTQGESHLIITDEFAAGTTPDFTIWDISNPAVPTKTSQWYDPNASIHNGYIRGDYLFTSFYSAGFRVFDISNPATPFMAAEYDVSSQTGEGLVGTFGCYPFTSSEHILVSDRPGGLFIFDFDELAVGIPSLVAPTFELHPAYPNPSTAPAIAFDLWRDGHVRIDIFDVKGRHVTTLLDGFRSAGPAVTQWQGTGSQGRLVPSGVYFARMTHSGRTLSRRFVLIR